MANTNTAFQTLQANLEMVEQLFGRNRLSTGHIDSKYGDTDCRVIVYAFSRTKYQNFHLDILPNGEYVDDRGDTRNIFNSDYIRYTSGIGRHDCSGEVTSVKREVFLNFTHSEWVVTIVETTSFDL